MEFLEEDFVINRVKSLAEVQEEQIWALCPSDLSKSFGGCEEVVIAVSGVVTPKGVKFSVSRTVPALMTFLPVPDRP